MDAYEGVRIRARCARGWYACGAYWVPGVLGAIARLGFPPLTPGLAWVLSVIITGYKTCLVAI